MGFSDKIAERDYRIDFLRALAILLIILAHTLVPNKTGNSQLIFNIRNFDVVLMCILVGMTSYMSFGRNNGNTLLISIKGSRGLSFRCGFSLQYF